MKQVEDMAEHYEYYQGSTPQEHYADGVRHGVHLCILELFHDAPPCLDKLVLLKERLEQEISPELEY